MFSSFRLWADEIVVGIGHAQCVLCCAACAVRVCVAVSVPVSVSLSLSGSVSLFVFLSVSVRGRGAWCVVVCGCVFFALACRVVCGWRVGLGLSGSVAVSRSLSLSCLFACVCDCGCAFGCVCVCVCACVCGRARGRLGRRQGRVNFIFSGISGAGAIPPATQQQQQQQEGFAWRGPARAEGFVRRGSFNLRVGLVCVPPSLRLSVYSSGPNQCKQCSLWKIFLYNT
jgi:hypothetical protein